MLSSNLSSKVTFLNKFVGSGVQQAARSMSVAFNVKSKFETAYEAKIKNLQA
jgi:hypothetical protein